MTIGTQEFHLCLALLLHGIVITSFIKQGDGTVHTRKTVVKTNPHIVDIPVGGEHTLLHLQLMEHVAIAGSATAFVGIIAAHVEIPHRERRVDIFGSGKDCVGRYHHGLCVLRCLYLLIAQRTLWDMLIQEVRAACQNASSTGSD